MTYRDSTLVTSDNADPWRGYVGARIRTTNRHLLWTNVVLVVGILLILWLREGYLRTWLVGARSIGLNELRLVLVLDDVCIQLDVPELLPTGMQEVERKGSRERPVADFQLVSNGTQSLIVKTTPGFAATHLEGKPAFAPTEVLSSLRRELPEEQARGVLPVMLDTVGYRSDGWLLLGAGVPALLLGSWNLLRWWRRWRSPASHPLARSLGVSESLSTVRELDDEIEEARRFGVFLLTAHWVVIEGYFRTRLARLDDLAWIYKKVTQQSVNFIPIGNIHEAHLWKRDGSKLSDRGGRARIDELLEALAEQVPWILSGYSPDLERAWKKDRGRFLEALDQRRAAVVAGQP